ncbi:aquaporin [bacterium]|nr:aquaporin [bacterium]
MIYVFGSISGAHLNPAVSLAIWLVGKFPGKYVLPYMMIQCAGAVSASLALSFLFPSHPTLGATLPAGSITQSFLVESLLSLILVFVILALSCMPNKKQISPALVIGAVIGLEAIFAGPISGASMNPARSIGPALVSGHTRQLWIYLVAPLIGSLTAVLIRVLFFQRLGFLANNRSAI